VKSAFWGFWGYREAAAEGYLAASTGFRPVFRRKSISGLFSGFLFDQTTGEAVQLRPAMWN
jgi:hypothetical protein